jgi:hypothetical protein
MAQKFAAIDASMRVENIILAQAGFELEGYLLVASDTAKIGDIYDATTSTFATPAPSLSEAKATLLAAVTEKRWQIENGGVAFGGATIRTDDKSQGKITSAVALFDNDPTLTLIDWEAQPGVWVTVDAATMKVIGKTAGRHVQACFSHARVLSEQINLAVDVAALAAIDIESGWPG